MGLMNDTTTAAKQQQQHPGGCDGGSISLCQLVNMSSKLCNLMYEDYANVSNELKNMMLVRLVVSDEPDGGAEDEDITSKIMSQYEGKLYLRRLYHAIHEQSMVVVNDNVMGTKFSDYTGSRQQCAYGCFCFLMVFFSMYGSTKLMKLKNIDWFQGTVIKGGCENLPLLLHHNNPPSSDQYPPSAAARQLLSTLGSGEKSIAKCIFDLVNTTNPSGGLVGPGNSLWFHNLTLKVFGSIGRNYKKLIKNLACIHDACGFLIRHLEIGPGYVYGLFNEAITVSSAGELRGFMDFIISTSCWLGQLTGLRMTWKLLQDSRVMTKFRNYDLMDESEEQIVF